MRSSAFGVSVTAAGRAIVGVFAPPQIRDKDKAATFSGNVKVVQGDTTMLCKTLVVFYDNDQSSKKPAMKSATPGPAGSSSIKRLEAQGGVVVTQKDSTVTGDKGVFDMRTNTVTMHGNVLLTKDKNVLRGEGDVSFQETM